MKRLLVLAALTGVLATQAVATAGHGNGAGAHWGRETVKLIDHVQAAWDSALDDASDAWNGGLTELQTKVVADTIGGSKCPYAKRAVRVCNGDYNFGGSTVGLAQYSYTLPAGHITKARVRVSNSTAVNARFGVVLHEVGHTLGLGHDEAGTSCMNAVVNPAITQPGAHDFAVVEGLHAHDPKMKATEDAGADEHRTVRREGDVVTVTWEITA